MVSFYHKNLLKFKVWKECFFGLSEWLVAALITVNLRCLAKKDFDAVT